MAMEIEETACYYCPWATDDLQTCINHVVEAHGERLLKVKTAVLDEQSGIKGMKTKNFGIIPNEILRPGQYLVANHNDWTVTVQEENTIEDNEIKQMDTDDGISFLEKSLQNLSIDIEIDDETFIASPLAKKAKCSTPMAKKEENYTKPKHCDQNTILDEMRMLLPNVLNEMKRNGHLETWLL